MKQEVHEPAIYNAVITAIATGSFRMSEISNKIEEDTSVCVAYIWWGANSKTKTQEEIDIMETDKDSALFGECK